jgi:triacylglycerol lipase
MAMGNIPSGTIPVPPWRPSDLPSLRAAYSDRTASLMAYLAAFAYDARVEARASSEVPDELAGFGFRRFTTFQNGLCDGFAYIAESDHLIVLSFRGTQSPINWKINFAARLIHPDATDLNLKVHGGFFDAFVMLSDGARGILEKMREVKTITQGVIPIYITGHSLGGALAQIASAVLGDDQVAACYTFGSPRVGNIYFDLWVKPPSYRLINYADIVPQVPLSMMGYRHAGDPRYLPDVAIDSPYRFEPNPLERTWQLIRGIIQFIRARSILGIDDHQIIEYCRKLDHIARARTQPGGPWRVPQPTSRRLTVEPDGAAGPRSI